MPPAPEILHAAQTDTEAVAFIEAFAKVNIEVIRRSIGSPVAEAARAERILQPDWDDQLSLQASGIDIARVDDEVRAGRRYLHIDVAASLDGLRATKLFLGFTGLSSKLQIALFPELSSRPPHNRIQLAREVTRLNAWLDWVRADDFDPSAFITYQLSIGIHGKTQNLTGAIGATGAAIAFIDAIRRADSAAIIDHVGELPPERVRSPREIFEWREGNSNATVKALLLRNG